MPVKPSKVDSTVYHRSLIVSSLSWVLSTTFEKTTSAGKMGPKMQLPDNVVVHEPKEEAVPMMPPQEQEEQQQYGGYNQGYNNQGYNQGGYQQQEGGY